MNFDEIDPYMALVAAAKGIPYVEIMKAPDKLERNEAKLWFLKWTAPEPIDAFVQKRLEGMRDRPRMYGSDEALEACAKLMLVFVRWQYSYSDKPNLVTRTYSEVIDRRHHAGNVPLHTLNLPNFSHALYDACQETLALLEARYAEPKAE